MNYPNYTQLSIFHNTIGLNHTEKAIAARRSKSQKIRILNFFRDNPRGQFTPFEVQQLARINAPITSIRRAITNLTKDGYLVKTRRMKDGQYGIRNHTWQLA